MQTLVSAKELTASCNPVNFSPHAPDNDTIYCFNYRSDRMREISSVLGVEPKPMEVDVPKSLGITTMSTYNSEFPFDVAFPPQRMTNVMAEWLAKQGCNQCHIAGGL